MNLENIETYSDRIPNEWVKKDEYDNYYLELVWFNPETKEISTIGHKPVFITFMRGITIEDKQACPGIITEQLTAILIHRHEEFNKKLPSEQSTKIVEHLKEVIRLTEERIEDRKNRGVHSENKL